MLCREFGLSYIYLHSNLPSVKWFLYFWPWDGADLSSQCCLVSRVVESARKHTLCFQGRQTNWNGAEPQMGSFKMSKVASSFICRPRPAGLSLLSSWSWQMSRAFLKSSTSVEGEPLGLWQVGSSMGPSAYRGIWLVFQYTHNIHHKEKAFRKVCFSISFWLFLVTKCILLFDF